MRLTNICFILDDLGTDVSITWDSQQVETEDRQLSRGSEQESYTLNPKISALCLGELYGFHVFQLVVVLLNLILEYSVPASRLKNEGVRG